MPFKDHLSKIAKSVGDTAQNAAKKSAEMLEVTKLNMSIQSEQDKIKAVKAEIGNIIFTKFEQGDNVDADVLEACSKIVTIKESILALQQKVAELKNVKLCCKCGNELPLNASFCQKCGSNQTPQETTAKTEDEPLNIEETKTICPICKNENPSGSAFWTTCGNKL